MRDDWPASAMCTIRITARPVFAGDTPTPQCGLRGEHLRQPLRRIRVRQRNLAQQSVELVVADKDDRLAAAAPTHRRCAPIGERPAEEEAKRLALQYQLISPYTAYVVVDERDKKADGLPELRVVPQMLAAGWGATSTVNDLASVAVMRRARQTDYLACADSLDIPAFLRKPSDTRLSRGSMMSRTPSEMASRLNARLDKLLRRAQCPNTLGELFLLGVLDTVSNSLEAWFTQDGTKRPWSSPSSTNSQDEFPQVCLSAMLRGPSTRAAKDVSIPA